MRSAKPSSAHRSRPRSTTVVVASTPIIEATSRKRTRKRIPAPLQQLRDKLIKIGAKVVSHGRYVIFQLAEVAVPQALFRQILQRIRRLEPIPDTG